MNRDSDRSARPDARGERHAVSITRMCLRSGSVQLPFALAGRLPQGELLVHDSERDEAIVLWSEPPRTLSGLGPLFEAHELQVNDQLVLELQGHDLRLGIRKRPRRTRPQVTPSTWESHRQPEAPRPDEDAAAPPDGAGDAGFDAFGRGPGAHDEGGYDPERYDGYDDGYGSGSHERDGREGIAGAAPSDARDPYADDPSYDDPYDDAPHAPRVRVSPLPNDGAAVREARGLGSSAPTGPREGEAGGWLGGVWRTARSWLGGGGERRHDADAPPAAPERDWTDAWGEGGEGDDDPLTPARGARPVDRRPASAPDRGPGADDAAADEGYVFEYDDAAFEEAPPARPRPTEPRRPEARRPDPLRNDAAPAEVRDDGLAADALEAENALDEAEDGRDVDPAGDAAEGDREAPGAGAPDEADRPGGPAARAAAGRPEAGVPSRAERFLAGDLRTRLLRFLTSPDMPLIAKSEMIASRFDLAEETARDMLADIADDPPPGIRLTPVREGAWRIERTRS